MKRHLFHRFIIVIVRYTVAPVIKRIMRYSCRKQKGPVKPSIIISNHNTNLDPVLIALSFSRHMYFIASEHVFRKGFKSRLLRFFLQPIPIDKTKNDVFSIKDMLNRLKSGASVCLFAEGDRSFNGTTGPIPLSTAKLVRRSGADLITFRLEGGYFTEPRWGKNQRKGKMAGCFINRYTAEELKSIPAEQVASLIERDIYEDAYERQKAKLIRFKGKKLAENIETALYLCPGCERIGTIQSKGDSFFCDCGLEATFTELGLLKGETLPFSTIKKWDEWQFEKLGEIIDAAGDEPICTDEGQSLYMVNRAKKSSIVGTGVMEMRRDAFHCAGRVFPIKHITRFTIVDRMTLVFALADGVSYEVRSQVPRSALKYREIFRILINRN